jgi:hypothetical protein
MIKRYKFLILSIFLILNSGISFGQTQKPWAYWWWLGSAVNEKDIKSNLEDYAKAGFGGMHIIPIYGVKNESSKNIQYLSPEWISLLKFTVTEAQKLGLGIDMSLGTGWPFGGPNVSKKHAAKKISFENDTLKISLTNQKVKRAAPGGEGLVVDHFDKTAVESYFAKFDSLFSIDPINIRAFYNDSYEVYDANWSNDFFEKFNKINNYKLEDHLAVLKLKIAETDYQKRIWADYHRTISELLKSNFSETFADFSNKHGKISRNESHGSPANVLDLYATASIPETEFFGSRPFDIKNFRQDPNYEPSRFGIPTNVVLKLASSAANVSNKSLVSSETSTWLGNHFNVALSQIKPIIDYSFLYGVNHVFYHGVPYSPPSEAFPGWLFYASTNYNQNSHFWNELPLLNKYIENCQSLLQKSKSDNEILLLLPHADLWQSVGKKNKTHPIDVHSIASSGLFTKELMNLIEELEKAGYQYDFISDKQITELNHTNGKLYTKAGVAYKALIIPKTVFFELETLNSLAKFKSQGFKNIFFQNQLPSKVSGYFDFEKKQLEFDKKIEILKHNLSDDIISDINKSTVKKESLTANGLLFTRKLMNGKSIYFIANQTATAIQKFIKIGSTDFEFQAYDPLTDKNISIENRLNSNKKTEAFINLASGKSIFLIESNTKTKTSKPIPLAKKSIVEVKGNWQIDFTQGKPLVPRNYQSEVLESWTKAPDTLSQYYNGYAKYTIGFEMSALGNTNYLVDLGDVRETAKVKINGTEIGTAWCLPFQLSIPKGVLKQKNILEIEVRNLSANQIRYLDKMGVNWKKFEDINFVDIQYKPFDASKWAPVPSGLLGPVLIISQ